MSPVMVIVAIVFGLVLFLKLAGFDYIPIWVLVILAYFIPALVAYHRRHRNAMAILVLNVFLGWTFLGWIAALVWACTHPDK